MDIRNRIKAFLKNAQNNEREFISPIPYEREMTPGLIAYQQMDRQREEAARAARNLPSSPLNWSPNYNQAIGNQPTNIASPYGEEQIPPMQRARQMAMGVPARVSTSWDDFVKTAQKISKETGYPLQVLLGQAAHETGHGKSAPGNAYFGIKGKGQVLGTQEATPEGQMYNTQASFRGYTTPEDSIRDYVNLITKDPRYAAAWKNRNNPKRMLEEIKKAGYATDPKYVEKVSGTREFQGAYGN